MTRRTRRRGNVVSKSLKRLKKALRKVAKDTNKIARAVDKVGVKAIKFGLKPILKPRFVRRKTRKCLRGQKRNRLSDLLTTFPRLLVLLVIVY